MSDRYSQIKDLEPHHAVSVLCGLLAVSRSGYYDWRRRTPSRRQHEDARLSQEVYLTFVHAHRAYGRPRLTRALQKKGDQHGERRIGRLMREAGCVHARGGAFVRARRIVATRGRSHPIFCPNESSS